MKTNTTIPAHATVDRLVNENIKLAYYWARKMEYRQGYNEALSIAMDGLLGAAQRFKADRGIPFGTYASIRIRWRFRRDNQMRHCQMRGGEYFHLSIDAPVREGATGTVGDTIVDGDTAIPSVVCMEHEANEDVHTMLAQLSDRNRKIMEMRYGMAGHHPHTLEQISVKFGLTRERVRQIEAGSLRKFWRDKRRKKLDPVRISA